MWHRLGILWMHDGTNESGIWWSKKGKNSTELSRHSFNFHSTPIPLTLDYFVPSQTLSCSIYQIPSRLTSTTKKPSINSGLFTHIEHIQREMKKMYCISEISFPGYLGELPSQIPGPNGTINGLESANFLAGRVPPVFAEECSRPIILSLLQHMEQV